MTQVSNINALRSYINASHAVEIRQKVNLINDLNSKKNRLSENIRDSLANCLQYENSLYNQGINDPRYHTTLENYNQQLKQYHDTGSSIINQINTAKNFEQLNQVETEVVNPFLNEVKNTYNYPSYYPASYPASYPAITQPSIVVHAVPSPQIIHTPPPVIHTHTVVPPPTVIVQQSPPVSPRPVRVVNTVPLKTVPVKTVKTVPVNKISVQPVNKIPVQTVQKVQVQKLNPVQTVNVPVQIPTLSLQTTQSSPQILQPSQTLSMVGSHFVISDYDSNKPGTLNLKRGKVVNVKKYENNWAMVETPEGHRGYV